MSPKISVIIPIYNVEEYLNNTVRSVVNQTLADLEIILVDDGSKDNCAQLIDNWVVKDSRILSIHKNNGGVTSARKAGLDKSSGEYIFFLDGDDYLLPDCLEKLYVNAVHAGADWVVSDFIIEFPDGKQMDKRFPDFGITNASGFLSYAFLNSDFYYTGRLIKASFIKSAITAIPEDITFGEDNLYVTQLGSQLNVALKVNVPSLVYVQRMNSVTNRLQTKDLQQRARACNLCYDYVSNLSFFEEIITAVDSYFIKEYCACIARGIVPSEMSFVHKRCHLQNSSLDAINRFFYILSLISSRLSVAIYKIIRDVKARV